MYLEINTNRLTLRPITNADGAFMLDLVNSPGWLKFIGDRNVYNIKDAGAYIQRILDNPLYFYHVIEMNGDKQPVGVISFLKRDDQKYFDLGFALLPAYEGKGVALEAASEYLTAIQSLKTFENIIAICVPDNLKSITLLQNLGFRYSPRMNKHNNGILIYEFNDL